jgi:hypothetical protein
VFPVRYELGFYIPEDGIFHSHRRKNVKSYIINGFTAHMLDLGRLFSFLILYIVRRTPWMGDQPVANPLSA